MEDLTTASNEALLNAFALLTHRMHAAHGMQASVPADDDNRAKRDLVKAELLRRLTGEPQYAIRHDVGLFECRDLKHAEGMMHTTSPVLGSKDSRRIVTRTVVATDWTEV